MNLAYPIDDTVEIDGTTYTLNMAYDNILRLFDLLNDDEVNDLHKAEIGLLMLIDDKLDDYDPQNKVDVFLQLFKSTVGKESGDNQPVDIEGNPMPTNGGSDDKVYSIKEDAEFIFASFYQDYGVDLFEQQGRLHWNKFKSMLGGLRKDTRFKEVIEIRTMELPTGKGSQKQRENIKKMKKQYALKGDD